MNKPKVNSMVFLKNLGIPILFTIFFPLVFYYGFRYFNFSRLFSLLASIVPILLFQGIQYSKQKKLDFLSLLSLVIIFLSAVIAIVTGSVRFMLAKSGFFTLTIGIVFLASFFYKKPLGFIIAKYFLQRMDVSESHLETLYNTHSTFKQAWKTSTLLWGVGILLNAILIFGIAYLLPVDWVPLLNPLVHITIFLLLQIVTHIYYHKKRIWKLIFNTHENIKG